MTVDSQSIPKENTYKGLWCHDVFWFLGAAPGAGLDVTVDFQGGASVPIGRPLPNCRAYVLDERLQLVPVGVPGELMVSGVQLARGYLKRDDLTADKFIANPYSGGRPHAGRLYRTGVAPAYLHVEIVRYRRIRPTPHLVEIYF